MNKTCSQLSDSLKNNNGDRHLKSNDNFQMENLYITGYDNILY